jgi:hypothetical protein
MSLYYNTDNYILQEIDDALYASWIENNNPKAQYYILAPDKPSENAIWNNGEWLIPQPSVPESISARQVRIWLIQHGISLSQVDAAIDSIGDPVTKEITRVDWEYAPYIERSHPMLIPLGQMLGLSESDIDTAFIEASIL